MVEKIHQSVTTFFEALDARLAAEAAEAAANPPAEAEVSPSEEVVADETAPEIPLREEDETADSVAAREAALAETAASSEAVTESDASQSGVGEAHSAASVPPETVVPAEPQPEKE
jgi:hypothetical protein